MRPDREEIASTHRATLRALEDANAELRTVEELLERAQRVPAKHGIEELRTELADLENEIEGLESYAIAYQRAVSRAEHLRGEIVSHRDLQTRLDRAEQRMMSVQASIALLESVRGALEWIINE